MARLISLCVLCVANAGLLSAETNVTVERSDRGAVIRVDGSLFAKYLTRSGRQPVIWPIHGPTGAEHTRAYPIGPRQESESDDHIHHRSLWFAHGDVNGFDFWGNTEPKHACEIVHREFTSLERDGQTATISTRNDWIAVGKKQCEDERTFVFGSDDSVRWIDFGIRLIATESDVKFGETKEGTFATRVAGTIKLEPPGQGQIVNSRGQRNEAAWGMPAEWVDYFGPVKGETVGIAILSHPSNFRHPCRWHVRPYGLFAANPFGESDFPPSELCQGEFVLPRGDSLTLRYRVVFHQGNEQVAKLRERYQDFSRDVKSATIVP